MKRILILACSILVLGMGAAAFAESTPIGPLPAGAASTITLQRGELVSLALPHRSSGRVWRIARPFDTKVLTQVSEGNVGTSVVLVFRGKAAGTTTVSIALTKSDASPKALESRVFHVRVH